MRSRPTIDPKKTALLVIDMQAAFLLPDGIMFLPTGPAIIPQVEEVVSFSRRQKLPVVWTRMSHATMCRGPYPEMWPKHFNPDGTPKLTSALPGYDLHPRFRPARPDLVVDKYGYSAFDRTGLDETLRAWGVDTVVIVGIATNVCCESTARDAFSRDYRVVVLSDATATASEAMRDASLKTIHFAFGWVMTFEELRLSMSQA